jgi:2-polyprenyl-3-methyl-5-hydroxy-6-metoxy-1,4-benzoquinol methylase
MQNLAFQDKNSEYYTHEKAWMVPFVKEGPNVVFDLGCASGMLGSKLLAGGRAKEIFGAEIFKPAAEAAAKVYKQVHIGDIEEMQLDYAGTFDYVICGDILEHLKDPYKVLKRIHNWLKPGGSVLVCVPDVRNFRVLRDLVFRGDWEYVSSGILDGTHLRFFTRRSCQRMLQEAGFEIYHAEMIIYGPKKTLFNKATLGVFEEFLATQVFCCGRKVN